MRAYNPLNTKVYIGLASEVAGLTGMGPGDKFVQEDTKGVYMYLGTSLGWVQLGSLQDNGTTASIGVALI